MNIKENKLAISLFVFLIVYSSFLHGSLFDWFYHEKKEFECPHNCGKWGSPSIQELEWSFTLLLHSADLITFPGIDPYIDEPRSVWLTKYPKPLSYKDKWCQEMIDSEENRDEFRLRIDVCDVSGSRLLNGDTYWGLKPVLNNKSTFLGIIFKREVCGWYYDNQSKIKHTPDQKVFPKTGM